MELKLLTLGAMLVILGISSSDAELIAYPHVGCYGGWRIRRYFNRDLGFWRGDDAVMQCYHAARKEGFKIFALTEGKCLSGNGAEKHYKDFDESRDCNKKGTGGRGAYDIYLVEGGKQSCEGLADGEYQDTTFCNRFYTCTNGQATVQLCPEGLLFNPASRECRGEAPCPRGAPCFHAPDGEYVHPISCRKYVVCHKGYAFEAACPAHLWFNTDTKECESPASVVCRNDPCMDSPCLNGGQCKSSSEVETGYTCACKEGFTGTRCEKHEPKPCNAKPCKNGGTCKDLGGNKYECSCKAGYRGKDCDEHFVLEGSTILDIVNDDQLKKLEEYLRPVNLKGKTWKLCFRASKFHFLTQSFHAQCDHKAPTVTLVRVGNHHVFGGYSDNPWTSSGSYQNTPGAFLFSLKNSLNRPFISHVYRHHGNAIYRNSGYGPTFGGGHDLYLANQCHLNTNSYTNLGHTYKPPFGYGYTSTHAKQILAGSYNFRCAEYEVFYLAY